MTNVNYIASELKINGSCIKSLEVENNIFALRESDKRKINISFIPSYLGKSPDGEERYGRVELNLNISIQSEDNNTSSIKACFAGMFSSNIRVDEEQFKNLVAINGAASLYSVARGQIETITASIFAGGKITIPLINVLDYYKDVSQSKKD